MKIISNIKIKRDFENKFQSCRLKFEQFYSSQLVLGGDFFQKTTNEVSMFFENPAPILRILA
jgi:hypothetical protein